MSNFYIEKWTRIIDNNLNGQYRTAKERLSSYLGSRLLGRSFNESGEDFLARQSDDYKAFHAWAMKIVG